MMRRRLWMVLWLALAPPFESNAAVCSTSAEVTSSPAYADCSSATGIDFTAKAGNKKSTFSAATFCANEACATLWDSVNSRGELACFQSYDSGQNKISNPVYATSCFIASGLRTPAPTTAAPTKKPTPTNNAGGNSAKASAASNANANRANSSKEESGVSGGSFEVDASATGVKTETVSPGTENSPVSYVSSQRESNKILTDTTSLGSSSGPQRDGAGSTSSAPNERVPDESGKTSLSGSGSSARSSRSAKTGQIRAESNESSSKDSDGGLDGGKPSSVWIASGGSSGGVVIVVVIFLYFRKRKARVVHAKRSDAANADDYLPTLDSSRSFAEPVSVFVASDRSLPPSRFAFWEDETINAVRIPYEKLEIGSLISRGGYGEVYRGTYRDQLVAVKSLLPERRKDMRQIERFLDEVKLMAKLEHANIVRFVGVAWDSLNELCVVSEFMARGDLRSLLARFAENESVHPKGFDVGKTKIALHVATALTYMHSLQPAVLHRDLKSRNVLLDADLNAKLTDFGISRERADSTMTIGVGSSLWMAPEVMVSGRYDDKADVFSFGVVMSELDTHSLPYAHALEPGTSRKLPDTVVVQMMVTGRISVEFTDEASSLVAQIGCRCVALDPADRPSAAELQHQLHQLWRYPDDSV